jgi:hypothetical protein
MVNPFMVNLEDRRERQEVNPDQHLTIITPYIHFHLRRSLRYILQNRREETKPQGILCPRRRHIVRNSTPELQTKTMKMKMKGPLKIKIKEGKISQRDQPTWTELALSKARIFGVQDRLTRAACARRAVWRE